MLEDKNASPSPSSLTIGTVSLDLEGGSAERGGVFYPLSPVEHQVLRLVAASGERAVDSGALTRALWREDTPAGRLYLQVFIRSLRLKLETDPRQPTVLLGTPARGYRLGRSGRARSALLPAAARAPWAHRAAIAPAAIAPPTP